MAALEEILTTRPSLGPIGHHKGVAEILGGGASREQTSGDRIAWWLGIYIDRAVVPLYRDMDADTASARMQNVLKGYVPLLRNEFDLEKDLGRGPEVDSTFSTEKSVRRDPHVALGRAATVLQLVSAGYEAALLQGLQEKQSFEDAKRYADGLLWGYFTGEPRTDMNKEHQQSPVELLFADVSRLAIDHFANKPVAI